MKKFLLVIGAFIMLFATSCQNDLEFGSNTGESTTVSFSVATPDIASRAYSDASTATKLQYAVYDAEGNELEEFTVTNGEIHGSTNVTLQLITGNKYSVIFWASAPNAPYTVDFGTKSMTVDYDNAVSNDENRDAFYKYHEFIVNGPQTEAIELKRPFAQLNIGTGDYAEAKKAGYVPTKSTVTVKNIYNTLNLATGVVSNPTKVTYGENEIPANESFAVQGYEYLAMNYLLVAADKEVVDVEFTCTDGSNAKTRTVGSVPVQRNYRTNIYGNLLTSDVNVNVVINSEYDDNFTYPSKAAEELILAATCGGKVTLTEDVILTNPLLITSNVELNLNGHSIKGGKDYVAGLTGTDISALTIDNGGNLIVDGVGSINGTVYGVYAKNGTLTIKGGNFVASTSAVQVANATVNIKGGNFSTTNDDKRYVINCLDANWKNGTAKVNINGGKFNKFDPANNAAEGEGTNFLV